MSASSPLDFAARSAQSMFYVYMLQAPTVGILCMHIYVYTWRALEFCTKDSAFNLNFGRDLLGSSVVSGLKSGGPEDLRTPLQGIV